MVTNCKRKINKKSFQNLCKDKLNTLKIQVCRTEIEELIYDLGICKDEKIDYVALNSYTSTTTVKRTLKKFYDRALNLPVELFDKIFNDTN
jgi:hypothetical protein